MPKKILVIDDEHKIVEICQDYLKASGFDVVSAADGLVLYILYPPMSSSSTSSIPLSMPWSSTSPIPLCPGPLHPISP